jgi:hypothetical protein
MTSWVYFQFPRNRIATQAVQLLYMMLDMKPYQLMYNINGKPWQVDYLTLFAVPILVFFFFDKLQLWSSSWTGEHLKKLAYAADCGAHTVFFSKR